MPGRPGRPRLKGDRLPSLHTVLTDPATAWTPFQQAWPDGTVRRLEYVSATAVWYHAGHPPVPLRWLLIRDPAPAQQPQALLSTDPALAPPQLLTWYLRRWAMEVTLQAVRTYLGVETQRQWSHQAILRTTHVLQKGQPIAPFARPGTPSSTPPSPMCWLSCARRSGAAPPFFACRRS